MRVLIAIDDSPHAQAAIDFAKTMTWPARSRAVVLSVVRPQVAAVSEIYVPAAPMVDTMWDEAFRHHQELASGAERDLQQAGLATTGKVVQGDPRIAIVDEAQDMGADLIVLGSHGRSGIAKLLMGSVATHVVTHAPCNVLVVKHPR